MNNEWDIPLPLVALFAVIVALVFSAGIYIGTQVVDIPPWCGPVPPACNCSWVIP